MDIVNFKKKFDPYLIKFLDKKLHDYKDYTKDAFILSLIAHTKKLVLSAGKRVRPYVAYLMYKSAGGKQDEKVIKLFVGLELFHNFCLVHDDIIDRGLERHGVATLHKHVSQRLQNERRICNIEHVGNSQAILIGDLLFAWSYEILGLCTDFDSKKLYEARVAFNKMVNEVIVGQMIDVDITTRKNVKASLVDQKMMLKTAMYTFVRPMEIGLALASDKSSLKEFCAHFGMSLGMGFQIQDDMLDIIANPKKLKKTVLSDLKEGNHNFFTQYIFDFGTEKQKKELSKVFGTPVALLNGNRQKVVGLFYDSGAIDNGVKTFEAYFNSARKSLSGTKISSPYKSKWSELIDYIEKRTA